MFTTIKSAWARTPQGARPGAGTTAVAANETNLEFVIEGLNAIAKSAESIVTRINAMTDSVADAAGETVLTVLNEERPIVRKTANVVRRVVGAFRSIRDGLVQRITKTRETVHTAAADPDVIRTTSRTAKLLFAAKILTDIAANPIVKKWAAVGVAFAARFVPIVKLAPMWARVAVIWSSVTAFLSVGSNMAAVVAAVFAASIIVVLLLTLVQRKAKKLDDAIQEWVAYLAAAEETVEETEEEVAGLHPSACGTGVAFTEVAGEGFHAVTTDGTVLTSEDEMKDYADEMIRARKVTHASKKRKAARRK
jgi:hypothetical protein